MKFDLSFSFPKEGGMLRGQGYATDLARNDTSNII